jgi:hypothetical protein
MSRYTARARSGQDRTSLYAEITDKIIAELEAGRLPWVQPWGTAAAKAPLAMPKNATTQRRYSGVNVLILWGAVIERGFVGQNSDGAYGDFIFDVAERTITLDYNERHMESDYSQHVF